MYNYYIHREYARMEACTLLFDGYRIVTEIDLQGRYILVLRHAANGNRMKVIATDKDYELYKNGVLVKKVTLCGKSNPA